MEVFMSRSRGFTLVEAAVAIGVVAILSGIIIPLVLKNLHDARYARARNDLQVIIAALASQMRDTGSRPQAGLGGGGAVTGAGDVTWQSVGNPPVDVAGAALAPLTAANTFTALFVNTRAAGNMLFGLHADRDYQYRGPYLGHDMLQKTDPWGNSYVILGYNLNGQRNGGPIWVVCAGELGKIAVANLTPAAAAPNIGQYGQTWDYAADGSQYNIAVRVN
jgi:type II secretory pathway pseudopilin PulG